MEGKKEDIVGGCTQDINRNLLTSYSIWGVVPGKPDESNELIHIKNLSNVTAEYDGKVLYMLQSYNCLDFKPRPPVSSPACARGNCHFTYDENLNITTWANGTVEKVDRQQQYEQQPNSPEAASQWGCMSKMHGLSMVPGWDRMKKYGLSPEDFAIRCVPSPKVFLSILGSP